MGSCKVATTDCSNVPSVPVSSSGCARGTPLGPTVATVVLLEVEPTFLARVTNATWHDADVDIRRFAHRARGPHVLLHVMQLHGFDFIFGASGE